MDIDLYKYKAFMVEKGASDLFFTIGAPPYARVKDELMSIGSKNITEAALNKLVLGLMNESQQKKFNENPEFNISQFDEKLGRFRINVYKQRNEFALVIRHVPNKIPSFSDLRLPKIVEELAMEERGLVLFVGATGSGKSTSLASLLDYRNENSAQHIITIEDPIEFVHTHKKGLISQREIGTDTLNYHEALRSALRQSPDVILIGEIRDTESMESAIEFSESGHLCLSSLHANNANQAIERVVGFFPESIRRQIYLELSFNLRGIVSQRLVPKKGNGEMVPAFEVLIATPIVKDMIRKAETENLKDIMEKSTEAGMVTFDQSLLALYFDGIIDEETAFRFADSKNNVRLQMTLANEGTLKPANFKLKEMEQIEQQQERPH